MEETCKVRRLGMVAYAQAWQLQNELAVEIAAGRQPPTLLLLQHPHTYTFGRSGHPENLLWDEAELARRGVEVHWVDRGGDVTYHGPGQLVGYPLLPLSRLEMEVDPASGAARLPQADYVGYLRRLEEVLIASLAQLGVAGERRERLTGVWVKPAAGASGEAAKIAAIGVKVDARGVSRHGFALNVATDKEYWQGIIGCGLAGYAVTSLAELLQPVPAMETVQESVVAAFGQVFGYAMV